jgi:hypothetical protein
MVSVCAGVVSVCGSLNCYLSAMLQAAVSSQAVLFFVFQKQTILSLLYCGRPCLDLCLDSGVKHHQQNDGAPFDSNSKPCCCSLAHASLIVILTMIVQNAAATADCSVESFVPIIQGRRRDVTCNRAEFEQVCGVYVHMRIRTL